MFVSEVSHFVGRNQENLPLDVRKKHLAVGYPLRADPGFYFFDTEKLVCEQRTALGIEASKPSRSDGVGKR